MEVWHPCTGFELVQKIREQAQAQVQPAPTPEETH